MVEGEGVKIMLGPENLHTYTIAYFGLRGTSYCLYEKHKLSDVIWQQYATIKNNLEEKLLTRVIRDANIF